MRRLATASVLLLAACRSKPRPADAPHDAQGPSAVSPPPAAPSSVLLSAPLSAARIHGATIVAARERAGSSLVLGTYFDTAPADIHVSRIGAMPVDWELLAASDEVAVLSREPTEGGSHRVLYRVAASVDAGPLTGDRIPVGDAVCATLDAIHWLERAGSGFQVWRRPIAAPERDVVAGPLFPSQSEVTLVCGAHRAFMASNVEGQVRVVAWAPDQLGASTLPASEVHPVTLPKPPLASNPDDMLMAAMDDGLVLVALESKSMAVAVFRPDDAATHWQKVAMPGEGATLEAIEGDSGRIGVLMLRTIPAAKGCRGGDANDTVAEVAVFDTEGGKLVHAPERIETWRCGAEPGPFFSGWAAGKFVIGWPRGADAACARAGLRHGGLGFAVVEAGAGRAHVGRTGPPSDVIAEAGCDALKCYAVALTRGSDPCGPADGPDVGRAEVIAYPP